MSFSLSINQVRLPETESYFYRYEAFRNLKNKGNKDNSPNAFWLKIFASNLLVTKKYIYLWSIVKQDDNRCDQTVKNIKLLHHVCPFHALCERDNQLLQGRALIQSIYSGGKKQTSLFVKSASCQAIYCNLT